MEMFAKYLSHQTHSKFVCEICGSEEDDSVAFLSHTTSCEGRKKNSDAYNSLVDQMAVKMVCFRADLTKWRSTVCKIGSDQFLFPQDWRCGEHPGDESNCSRSCAYTTAVTPLIKDMVTNFGGYIELRSQAEQQKTPVNYHAERRDLKELRSSIPPGEATRMARMDLSEEILILGDLSTRSYIADVKKLLVDPEKVIDKLQVILKKIKQNDLQLLNDIERNGYKNTFTWYQIVAPPKYISWINYTCTELDKLLDKRNALVVESTELMRCAIQALDVDVLDLAKEKFTEILCQNARILVYTIPAHYFYNQLIKISDITDLLKDGNETYNRLCREAKNSYNYVFENKEEIEEMWAVKNRQLNSFNVYVYMDEYKIFESAILDLHSFAVDHAMNRDRDFDENKFNADIIANYLDIAISEHVQD
uniref:HEPN_DZIP3 domain-containing protein n=1 Tax=Caenorhabditis tropicalis TaxID=1561998 RepID=A0A1I7TRK1_9PELO